MNAAVFIPDPLLARAAPAPRTGFGVLTLLAPVEPAFEPHPLMSPPSSPGAEALSDVTGGVGGGTADEAHGTSSSESLTGDADLAVGFEATPAVLPDAAQAAEPGLADGRRPETEDWTALLEQRYREGFEDGLAQGARLAGEGETGLDAAAVASALPAAASRADAVLLLESLSRALAPLLLPDDAAARFEPLKRLALHLAMELVRTELSVSPKAVHELIRRSVQALQASDTSSVVVELNPVDLALLRDLLDDPAAGADVALLQRVKWAEDGALDRGSVRARSDASSVEDLIQQRLASIIQDLRIQADQWHRDEALLAKRLEGARVPTGDDPAGPGDVADA